jgi:hypothetical protein
MRMLSSKLEGMILISPDNILGGFTDRTHAVRERCITTYDRMGMDGPRAPRNIPWENITRAPAAQLRCECKRPAKGITSLQYRARGNRYRAPSARERGGE